MSHYDYFDFESLRGWTGKFHCHILQVCKETYDDVYSTVEMELPSAISHEGRYTKKIIYDEWKKVHNVKTLKRFVKDYQKYFDYRVVFKYVRVWDDTYVFCMLRPIG